MLLARFPIELHRISELCFYLLQSGPSLFHVLLLHRLALSLVLLLIHEVAHETLIELPCIGYLSLHPADQVSEPATFKIFLTLVLFLRHEVVPQVRHVYDQLFRV